MGLDDLEGYLSETLYGARGDLHNFSLPGFPVTPTAGTERRHEEDHNQYRHQYQRASPPACNGTGEQRKVTQWHSSANLFHAW